MARYAKLPALALAAACALLLVPAAAAAYAPICIGYDGDYAADEATVAGTCSAFGNDPHHITITAEPAKGAATVANQDSPYASVVYTATWGGGDTVRFRASSEGEDAAEVTIRTVNSGPDEPPPDPPPTEDPPPEDPPPADPPPEDPPAADPPAMAPPATVGEIFVAAGKVGQAAVASASSRAYSSRGREAARCKRIKTKTRKGKARRRACLRKAKAAERSKRRGRVGSK
jgi:hypothetical protein